MTDLTLPRDLVSHLVIQSGTMMATLRPDGTVEFGPDYQPDETAQAFWNGLATRNPLWARVHALEAAARAVVDAAWSPSTNVYLAGSLICRICMSPDGAHTQSCPVGALAALLEPG